MLASSSLVANHSVGPGKGRTRPDKASLLSTFASRLAHSFNCEVSYIGGMGTEPCSATLVKGLIAASVSGHSVPRHRFLVVSYEEACSSSRTKMAVTRVTVLIWLGIVCERRMCDGQKGSP